MRRRHFTDTENTGFAAVPRPTSTDDDSDSRREAMEEIVWSHRLPQEER